MPRMALGVAYDGTHWEGWQTQPHRCTVQDTFEAALRQFAAQPVRTTCAGRTDTGVHGLAQVIHFDVSVERRLESWVRGVNALLPDSIAVQWACTVPDTFHARFSALSRTYVYVLRTSRARSPITHARVGWVHYPLDLQLMRQAALLLIGEHDFSSFRSSQCQAASPIRTLHSLHIEQRGEFFIFTFQANAFLHHMVRNLMGVILYVGRGRNAPQWAAELLAERDRRLAAPTFSPDGLYLAQVEYPAEFSLPMATLNQTLASHLILF
ncbi:MAG: tRNA pseudouridine(38-40) synthase TruA [Burkholderiaceae bacterium]